MLSESPFPSTCTAKDTYLSTFIIGTKTAHLLSDYNVGAT